MIDIDGIYYYIDTEKLFDFLCSMKTDNKNESQTIVQAYGYPRNQMGEFNVDEKFQLLTKEVSEGKQGLADTQMNLRYDMFKTLLSVLVDVSQNDYGSGGEHYDDFTLNDLTFGQRIALNTLMNLGIIAEKKEEE